MTTHPIASAFINQSRHYLRGDYLPKIERALTQLTDDAVWWRPNEASNSIGNLLLHLSGNIRQWIVSGIGGADDTRQRQQEFDARQPLPKAELLAHLRATLAEVDTVLSGLTDSDLVQPRRIQGTQMTVMAAIYHVVEHFSMHTGQILWITKLHTSTDLSLYDITPEGIARPKW